MAWFLLLLPLLSSVICFLGGHRSKLISITSSCVSILGVLGLALAAQWGYLTGSHSYVWLQLPSLSIEFSVLLDPLSKSMLLIVAIVGTLVHLFSLGYMSDDPDQARFFGKLSLFIFSMIGIVVSNNLIQMFIFWELVGLSSYLLIGFWFKKDSAADAANKAFLANRVGDFGFMLGILGFWSVTGSFLLSADLKSILSSHPLAIWIALGLFMGCVGKSAQLPLHVWLPDAMEGPTPVSALIHAATMVAAGIYMLCRVYFVFEAAPDSLLVVALTGGITAIVSALIATQQNDIKRILAYSTLSQLGYMVLAVGCGGPSAAMFHLTTHAMFKALLFLCAGSVIHAVHHEQNIWKMGGLYKKIPLTFWTFTIGYLCLIGVPYLSGFFSKEEILGFALFRYPSLFWVAVLTAVLTAFYMTRLYLVVFFGKPRSEHAEHAHESSWLMTVPLLVLAFASVAVGYMGVGDFLEHLLPGFELPHDRGHFILWISVSALITGVTSSVFIYQNKKHESVTHPLLRLVENKLYIDELYSVLVLGVLKFVSRVLLWIDTWVMGVFLVRGVAASVALGGQLLRLLQSGSLQLYVLIFSLGATLLLIIHLHS